MYAFAHHVRSSCIVVVLLVLYAHYATAHAFLLLVRCSNMLEVEIWCHA
uniref:Uncharacterized protein n=1 Tax=Arundo donax TaxID=35708 RepID=A0A0A9BXG6_ARUDO